MTSNIIGSELRRLRKQLKLTQLELCEGICDQSMLSKIEKGETYPSANILYALSDRLNVDMEYFFKYAHIPDISHIKDVQTRIREAIREKDYETVKQIINKEETNELYLTSKDYKQFLLWHKGICLYYCDHQPTLSIRTLKTAISLRDNSRYYDMFSEQEIEILNTIGVIYSEQGELDKAEETLNDCIKSLEHRIIIKNNTINIRIIYNLGIVLTRNKKYDKSIILCQDGINKCLKNNLLYLYGELTYHIGYNLELQNKHEKSIQKYEEAIQIFKLQGNNKYIHYINNRIANLMKTNNEVTHKKE